MKDNHIIDILDGTSLSKLDESQLRIVRGTCGRMRIVRDLTMLLY